MNILVTNDDGFRSELTLGLVAALRYLSHKVTLVAPKENKSASSHSITLGTPISVYPQGEGAYAIDGTPADCIFLGIDAIMKEEPDLIVSGINDAPNFGIDIIYSGTVAAAREAFMRGYKAIAISKLIGDEIKDSKLIQLSVALIDELLKYPLDNYFFNVNIPNIKDLTLKYKLCSVSTEKRYQESVKKLQRFHNNIKQYEIGGEELDKEYENNTDAYVLSQGIISVTPLANCLMKSKNLKLNDKCQK